MNDFLQEFFLGKKPSENATQSISAGSIGESKLETPPKLDSARAKQTKQN